MFTTYRSIAQHLKDQVPDLRSIDRDKGQLDNPESFESIVTPAALLDFSEIKWSGKSRGEQIGIGTITVRLLFPLPASTRFGADWNAYENSENISGLVYHSLLKHQSVGDRRSGGDYFEGAFYVCEQTFDLKIYQEMTIKRIPKPFPDIDGNLQVTINL